MHWTAESFSIEKYDAFVSDKRIPIYKVLYEDNHTESPPVGYQTLKQEKVHALCKRFESEGCRRNDYPVFVRLLKNKYVCLDGKHRLEAGKIFLRPDDQLWRALVFNTSDPALLHYLRNSPVKLPPDSDGDIYRIVRHYESAGNDRLASAWKAKKTSRKGRFFSYIDQLRLPEENGTMLVHRLNRLLPFGALWADFTLGCHRMESPCYVTEVAHYVDQIYKCWSSICGDQPETVTVSTIRKLEGRYPQLSSQDALYVTERFENFDVFETVHDERKRKEMLSTILHHRGRILSLRLLLEDTKVLEPTARMMKLLISRRHIGSLKAFMETCFENSGADSALTSTARGDFESAYRHLWLYAWENFPGVIGNSLRRSSRCSEPPTFQSRPWILSDFAVLARRLGFDNAQISRLATSPWRTRSIEGFLEGFTRGGSYKASDMEAALGRIEPIFDQFLRAIQTRQHKAPVLAHDLGEPGDEQRCGMPFEETFNEDGNSLQMQFIYAPCWEDQTSRSRYISSFGFLGDQFRCFFGASEDLPSSEASAPPYNAASTTHDEDEANALFMMNDGHDKSPQSDVSDDVFVDACQVFGRKRSCSAESQSSTSKATRRK